MLKQRVTTAAVMLLIFLCGLFLLPEAGFMALLSLVLLAGIWEWSNLAGFTAWFQRILYCLLALALTGGVVVVTHLWTGTVDEAVTRTLLLVAASWWALALLWIQGYPGSAVLWGSRWIRGLMGWLVLIPAWLALAYLYRQESGTGLIILMAAAVSIADIGAYFFGKAMGRHKLVVAVSPGKTLEGFLGGLVSCLAFGVAVTAYRGFDQWLPLLVILLCTALAAVLGDLLESMVKRQRNVKDSGKLLPGHGGILDRLDSFSAAAPIFALGIILTGWTWS